MHGLQTAPLHIEHYRDPLWWNKLDDEPEAITKQKIIRANALNKKVGVVAVLFSAQQVANRIRELAQLEHATANGLVDNTVYTVMLKGGNPFAVPFFREMASLDPTMAPIVDYIDAGRYGKSQRGRRRLKVKRKLSPETDIADKRVVGIEDTVDEGITMDSFGRAALGKRRFFKKRLSRSLGRGVTGPAASLGLITLTDKNVANLSNFQPDSIMRGFWVPNVWIGGMGLDGPNEANRWIPELIVPAVQDIKYQEEMAEVIDMLGERAVLGMDDITWISKKAA